MMGSNSDGQLGIGDNCPDFHIKDCTGAPCLVDVLRDFKVERVSCGRNFTFAIVESPVESEVDLIYAWGSNKYGQLGVPGIEKAEIPFRLTHFE